MRDLPTGTLTLLFTDIEGSTRLLHALGDRYPDVLATHRDILRAAFHAHDGVEVDTQGDAFFYVFPRATRAVAAAVDAQRALAAQPWPEGPGTHGAGGVVRVRMGLHTGEPQRTAEGYAGLDVHRAARICAAGHGGQVLLSQAAADLVRHALPDAVQLRNMGAHRLKDLVAPEHLWQVDGAGLPAGFPPIRSLDTRPNNLPTPATPLIGREHEIDSLVSLLRRDDVRLVTLTGPGGTGKTRLGLRVAAELLHDFIDGAFFVSLAPVTSPEYLLPAIAAVVGVRETSGHGLIEALNTALRDRQLLLLLDNFEQVVTAAPLVANLLTCCPRLNVLVTSQAVLHVSGEREFTVSPLALPDPTRDEAADTLARYPAVALFVERAVAVKPDFSITQANARSVVDICRRLDGLPLAIELAAARIKLLSPRDLLGRLDQRLKLLTGGARDLPARQQTLRATLAWSYDLLTAAEQRLLQRLAAFAGGWTLEAAESVCDPSGDLAIDVLDGLASLADKSLIKREESPDGESRFRMFETIWEFAREQLEESGGADPILAHHLEYFLTLAEQGNAGLYGPEQATWLKRLTVECDNFRAALAWSRTESVSHEKRLGLVEALQYFWFLSGMLTEGRDWLEDALARTAGECTPVRAQVLRSAGEFAWNQGDSAAARSRLEESLSVWQKLGDDRGLALAFAFLGQVVFGGGEQAAGRAMLEESVARLRVAGDRPGLALALGFLGHAAYLMGEPEAAAARYAESLAIDRQTGDTSHAAFVLRLDGYLALSQGDSERAASRMAESLELNIALGGDQQAVAACLMAIGGLAATLGRADWGARLLGVAAELLETLGMTLRPRDQAEYNRSLFTIRAGLGDAALERALAEGRALSLEQAIAEALAVAAQWGTGDGDSAKPNPSRA